VGYSVNKPRKKTFHWLRVWYWEHPAFGPEVSLTSLTGEDEYGLPQIEVDATNKEVAKELRQIADWLDKL
jgi:hypothetical protein